MFLARLALFIAFFSGTLALPSELNRRQVATNPNAALPEWTFVGCFTDANYDGRTLQEHATTDPGMTPALCTEFCANFITPLNFAGTEFTDQCFCDFNIQGTATKIDDTLCNFPCGGDSTLTCGGASLISIFQNNNTGVGPVLTNKATVGDFIFSGYFKDIDGTTTPTLSESLIMIPDGATVETCTATGVAKGFSASSPITSASSPITSASSPITSASSPITCASSPISSDPTTSASSPITSVPPPTCTTTAPTTPGIPTSGIPPRKPGITL